MEIPTRYIAFIDVLGFKDLLKSGQNGKLQDYINAMSEWHKNINDPKDNRVKDIEIRTISDSIVIYNKIAPDVPKMNHLGNIIYVVNFLQSNLLAYHIYVRGAITEGELAVDDETGIIAGNGLVAAYELEKEVKFPRVVIDDKIIFDTTYHREQFIQDYANAFYIPLQGNRIQIPFLITPQERFQTSVLDNNVFINYGLLRAINYRFNDDGVLNIYADIRENLYTKPSVKEKFAWLSKYLSFSIEQAAQLINFNYEDEKERLMTVNEYKHIGKEIGKL